MKELLEKTSLALDEARLKLDARDEKIRKLEEKEGSYSHSKLGTIV